MNVAVKSVNAQIDAALDTIEGERSRLLTYPSTAWRSQRLADLATAEADWWGVLFEHSRARAQWRAALTAREAARAHAARWRRLAVRQAGQWIAVAAGGVA